jgi:predicted GTPase
VITGIGCNQRHSVSYELLGKPEELAQICDLKTLKEIGMAYRLQAASEMEAGKLATLLLTDSAGSSDSSISDNAFVQSLMNRKIKRDFETGNIVIVKGWVLALTEARQCALLFVNNP